ncbi:MAG: extracellular solute-binding protein [Burkholderiales bacterium]|nr:extracellular solute-binding protein [Burkholderiales bacterium]
MTTTLDRRSFLAAGLGLGASLALPRRALAADSLVVATFPGTWNEAHSKILAPYFRKRTGASVTQTIQLAHDQIAKLAAAGGKPPFDVAILDDPQVLDAIKQGLIVEYPTAKSPSFKELLPEYQDRWGPKISMQVIGIGYNPKRVKNPPTSWDALFDPKYKGRVGLTALNSQLGIAFLAELNRIKGGSLADFEPAFKALRAVLPNVGAIGANLGAYATLWQQEQIDIAPYNFNFVQTLKGRGVPVELAIPDTGAVGWRTSLHLVKDAVAPDLAVQYIDSHLVAEVQAQMQQAPYNVIPTNGKVALTGEITRSLGRTHAELAKIRTIDWEKLNPQRSALIERFNREIRV